MTDRPLKRYIGIAEGESYEHVGKVFVTPNGEEPISADNPRTELPPRLDLRNHSPTGFAWNYYGSGPAQLSLALLADATGDDELALKYYQRFKADCIALLPKGDWELTQAYIKGWLREKQE